ncbi:hypothetical protein SELMODRAFT_406188 [Selaginella moellendorffii]|uniref:Uncharacterized protein n=1 Tax=Selaginella moellendorffii TaxID=88036 RepID=D8R1K0_SELML|nr:hypothetical protein SELMODRAFT_406188 [Selaginella moellendorffii]
MDMLLSCKLLLRRYHDGEQLLDLDLPGGAKTFHTIQRYVHGDAITLTVEAALDLYLALQILECVLPLRSHCRDFLRSTVLVSWKTIVRALLLIDSPSGRLDWFVAECRCKLVVFLESLGVAEIEDCLRMKFMNLSQPQVLRVIKLLRQPSEGARKALALNENLMEALARIYHRIGTRPRPNKAQLLHLLGDLMQHPHPRLYHSQGGEAENFAAFLAVALAPLREAPSELLEKYSLVLSRLRAWEMARLDPHCVLAMVAPWNELERSTAQAGRVFAAVERYVGHVLEQDARGHGRDEHFKKVASFVAFVASSSVDDSHSSFVSDRKKKPATAATPKPCKRKLDLGSSSVDDSHSSSVSDRKKKPVVAAATRNPGKRKLGLEVISISSDSGNDSEGHTIARFKPRPRRSLRRKSKAI